MSIDPVDRFKDDLGRALVAYAEHLVVAPASAPPCVLPPAGRARRGRAAYVIAGALAALVATVLGVTLGAGSAPPPATAATVLRSAALAALRQPSDALARGQYWYVDVRSVYGPPQPRYFRDRIWTARDGAGVDRSSRLGGTQPSARRLHRSAKPFPFGFERLSYAQLRALPTMEGELGALLRREAARQQPRVLRQFGDTPLLAGTVGRTYILFEMVRDALAEPTSPALRAALYRVAARLPFHLDGPMRDHIGRAGIGISFVIGWMRFRMIVKPVSGELLETQRIVLPAGRKASGQRSAGLYARYTYMAARVVDGLSRAG